MQKRDDEQWNEKEDKKFFRHEKERMKQSRDIESES